MDKGRISDNVLPSSVKKYPLHPEALLERQTSCVSTKISVCNARLSAVLERIDPRETQAGTEISRMLGLNHIHTNKLLSSWLICQDESTLVLECSVVFLRFTIPSVGMLQSGW
ncbi:uncharacterized protein PV09_02170 [Verruconis gallopava]|uniref:Uncharacterized protein n=1 Tax=Verruconis gallopava TaxID=253628 RepID=A0A0D2ALC1_9PEZI|nr:uncharacterized protein PV09_02170 [Verruconis gallopava]KIW07320.1 hypothetical protein PV09_02170 [Verruconis gallopava]